MKLRIILSLVITFFAGTGMAYGLFLGLSAQTADDRLKAVLVLLACFIIPLIGIWLILGEINKK